MERNQKNGSFERFMSLDPMIFTANQSSVFANQLVSFSEIMMNEDCDTAYEQKVDQTIRALLNKIDSAESREDKREYAFALMKITCGLVILTDEKLRAEVVNRVHDLMVDYFNSYEVTNPERDTLAEAQIVAIAKLYMHLKKVGILPESASKLTEKIVTYNARLLEWMNSFSPKTGWGDISVTVALKRITTLLEFTSRSSIFKDFHIVEKMLKFYRDRIWEDVDNYIDNRILYAFLCERLLESDFDTKKD
ncbi:MAG: hypothetical protein MJZ71_02490 [Bacteroidales bacterium]|nr:hypothetical protein [Bacteroidales bacterium]